MGPDSPGLTAVSFECRIGGCYLCVLRGIRIRAITGDRRTRTVEDRHGTGLGSNRQKQGQGSAGTNAGMTITQLAYWFVLLSTR